MCHLHVVYIWFIIICMCNTHNPYISYRIYDACAITATSYHRHINTWNTQHHINHIIGYTPPHFTHRTWYAVGTLTCNQTQSHAPFHTHTTTSPTTTSHQHHTHFHIHTTHTHTSNSHTHTRIMHAYTCRHRIHHTQCAHHTYNTHIVCTHAAQCVAIMHTFHYQCDGTCS